jgi:sporulation protein YlmC with PRC-barrel domain
MKKKIKLSSRVWAKNEKVGMVTKIVVDPETHEPGYLVVKRGRIRLRHIVVPVSLVSDVTTEGVVLDTPADVLDGFPDYEMTVQKGEYHKPVPIGSPRPYAFYEPPSNQGYMALRQRTVPDTTVSVEKGMAILDSTSLKVGRVDGLVMDSEKQQAIQILLRQPGPGNTRHRIIPADLVDNVRGGAVHLRIRAEHVNGLGFYEPESK